MFPAHKRPPDFDRRLLMKFRSPPNPVDSSPLLIRLRVPKTFKDFAAEPLLVEALQT